MENWKTKLIAILEKALQKRTELVLQYVVVLNNHAKRALSDNLSKEFLLKEWNNLKEETPQLMAAVESAIDLAITHAYLNHGEKEVLALIKDIRLFLKSESEEGEQSCRD